MANALDFITAAAIDLKDDTADLLRVSAPYPEAVAQLGDLTEYRDRQLFPDSGSEARSASMVMRHKVRARARLSNLPRSAKIRSALYALHDALNAYPATRHQVMGLGAALLAVLAPSRKMSRATFLSHLVNEVDVCLPKPSVALMAGAIRSLIRSNADAISIAQVLTSIAAERARVEELFIQVRHLDDLYDDAIDILICAGDDESVAFLRSIDEWVEEWEDMP